VLDPTADERGRQESGHQQGGGRVVVDDLEMRRAGVVPRRREHERDAAVRIGDGLEVGECALDHGVVEASDLREDLERERGGRRLAHRSAQVGLERVAEPAVGVAVGTQRFDNGVGGAVTE
jgi:hypothetical protein